MFPRLSDAKIKGGIFVVPQKSTLLKSKSLEAKINKTEKEAWQAFQNVVNGFLGNKRNQNYKELVKKLIKSYQNTGCRMSVKLHFLCSHLDFFQENLGDFSEEHGERFHQDIEPMEKRYKGRWDSAMIGDYIWSLVRQHKSGHKRKACSTMHF